MGNNAIFAFTLVIIIAICVVGAHFGIPGVSDPLGISGGTDWGSAPGQDVTDPGDVDLWTAIGEIINFVLDGAAVFFALLTFGFGGIYDIPWFFSAFILILVMLNLYLLMKLARGGT